MAEIYLDHAATAPLRPEARDAMVKALDEIGGNPSGSHAVARMAKNALEESRERAAELLGADRPDEIVFTGGGTESDNLAIIGSVRASAGRAVVTSTIEHKAVLEAAKHLHAMGSAWSTVGCDRDGVVMPTTCADVVGGNEATVSVMAANNETGALQPVAEIAGSVRGSQPGVVVHTDAVQAFVGGEVTVASTRADLITLSAHKFGGPKGVGLLYVRPGTPLEPLVHGGGQEAGRRSGTANVPGIVGMVEAMAATVSDRDRFRDDVGVERDRFEAVLADRLPKAAITAREVPRMPHFSHVRFPEIRAETLLIRLDRIGVRAAAGSACQSGAIEPSHVLTAMGMAPAAAAECVRFSFGWASRVGDGEAAAHIVADMVDSI